MTRWGCFGIRPAKSGAGTARAARNREALRLGRRLGIEPEDVFRRWRDGFSYCGMHSCWESPRCNPWSSQVQGEMRAKGICVRCQKRPIVPDRMACAECLEYGRLYEQERRRRLKAGAQ